MLIEFPKEGSVNEEAQQGDNSVPLNSVVKKLLDQAPVQQLQALWTIQKNNGSIQEPFGGEYLANQLSQIAKRRVELLKELKSLFEEEARLKKFDSEEVPDIDRLQKLLSALDILSDGCWKPEPMPLGEAAQVLRHSVIYSESAVPGVSETVEAPETLEAPETVEAPLKLREAPAPAPAPAPTPKKKTVAPTAKKKTVTPTASKKKRKTRIRRKSKKTSTDLPDLAMTALNRSERRRILRQKNDGNPITTRLLGQIQEEEDFNRSRVQNSGFPILGGALQEALGLPTRAPDLILSGNETEEGTFRGGVPVKFLNSLLTLSLRAEISSGKISKVAYTSDAQSTLLEHLKKSYSSNVEFVAL